MTDELRYGLVEKGYVPFDKSWIIRLGVIDLLTGYDDTLNFLDDHYKELGDDLRALHDASVCWVDGSETIDVGESATLYRFLRFADHKLGNNRTFIRRGTLEHRYLGNTPETLDGAFEYLAGLPTSQWASAYMLFDYAMLDRHTPGYDASRAKYKLRLTREAIEHWERAVLNGKPCEVRYDETINAQASAYLQWLKEGRMEFVPQQAEDYCFATSRDHRVVQAIAMLKRDDVAVRYPDCVSKSWPQFWRFYRDAPGLSRSETAIREP